MADSGHIVAARRAGRCENRTLVRDVIFAWLAEPAAPAFIRYDGTRLVVSRSRPLHGVWRQAGPWPRGVTVMTVAKEVAYLAAECRSQAQAGV